MPNISKEEIKKAATKFSVQFDQAIDEKIPLKRWYIVDAFNSGANWMQEKLANQYRTAGLHGDDGKTLSKDGYYALRMNVMVCRKKPIEGEDECVKIMNALHDDEGWVAVGPETNNPSTSEWISVEDGLPECKEPYGDSDYVLGFEDTYPQVVAVWYNDKSKEWRVAHYKADSLPVKISHWQPLPNPPKSI